MPAAAETDPVDTAADAAAKAASTLIATHLSGDADRALVDRTIAGLGGSRLN